MAGTNCLLIVNEDEVGLARRELAAGAGLSPLNLFQTKYTNPAEPGKTFYVCHAPIPASGVPLIESRAAEILEGTYLVLDTTGSDPGTELANRGYVPANENPFDRWPLDQGG